MISWGDWKFVASYYTCVIDVNQKYQQSYCHNYMRWSKSCPFSLDKNLNNLALSSLLFQFSENQKMHSKFKQELLCSQKRRASTCQKHLKIKGRPQMEKSQKFQLLAKIF